MKGLGTEKTGVRKSEERLKTRPRQDWRRRRGPRSPNPRVLWSETKSGRDQEGPVMGNSKLGLEVRYSEDLRMKQVRRRDSKSKYIG